MLFLWSNGVVAVIDGVVGIKFVEIVDKKMDSSFSLLNVATVAEWVTVEISE